MTDDDALITLDEAAKLIPGADADTLKRMHRAGKLVCYKPGKKLLTTAANVQEAVRTNYRAGPKGTSGASRRRDYGAVKRRLGSGAVSPANEAKGGTSQSPAAP